MGKFEIILLLLFISLIGCKSKDIRECGICNIKLGEPIYFKLYKNKDTVSLGFFTKYPYDPYENFYYIIPSKKIDSLKLLGYKIDSIKFNGINFYSDLYFRRELNSNFIRFKTAFRNSDCVRYQADCIDNTSGFPCCN